MDSAGDFASGANETSGRPKRSTASFAKNKRVVASVEGRWTEEEHKRFIEGLKLYGKQWMKISHDFVPTRTPIQVRSHAQKFLLQCERQGVDGESNVDMEDLVEGEGATADGSAGSMGDGETLASLHSKTEDNVHSGGAFNPDAAAVPSPLPVLSREGSGMIDVAAGPCNASEGSGRSVTTAVTITMGSAGSEGAHAAFVSAGPASSKDGDETSVGFAPDATASGATASPGLTGEGGPGAVGGGPEGAVVGEPDKRRSRRPGPSILVTRPVSLAASARQELAHMKDVLHHARQQAEARAEAAATAAAVSLIGGAAAGAGTEPGLADQPPAGHRLAGRRGSNQAAELPQSPRKRTRAGRPGRPAKDDASAAAGAPRPAGRRRAGATAPAGSTVHGQEQGENTDDEDDAVYIETELGEDELVLAPEDGTMTGGAYHVGAAMGPMGMGMGMGMAMPGGYYMGGMGMAPMQAGYMPMGGMTPFYRDASGGSTTGGAQAMPMGTPMMMMPMAHHHPMAAMQAGSAQGSMEGVTHSALGKSPVAPTMPMGAVGMPMMYATGPAGMHTPYVMMVHMGGQGGPMDPQSMMAMGAMNMNAMMMGAQGSTASGGGAPVVYTRAGGSGRTGGVMPVDAPANGWRGGGGEPSRDVGMEGSPTAAPMQGVPFPYAQAMALGFPPGAHPMGAYTTSLASMHMQGGMMAGQTAPQATGGKGARSGSASSAASAPDADMQVETGGGGAQAQGEDLDALLVALERKGRGTGGQRAEGHPLLAYE